MSSSSKYSLLFLVAMFFLTPLSQAQLERTGCSIYPEETIYSILDIELINAQAIVQACGSHIKKQKKDSIYKVHQEFHDRVYRPNLSIIINYIIEHKDYLATNKYIEIFGVSFDSVDESRSFAFLKILEAFPELVSLKIKALKNSELTHSIIEMIHFHSNQMRWSEGQKLIMLKLIE